jgi:hypothetical protein
MTTPQHAAMAFRDPHPCRYISNEISRCQEEFE